jgi:hypothetical protein
MSAAVWYRRSRSFSSAFAMIRSSSGGTSGLSSIGARGSRLRIASKITADVLPANMRWPVAAS